jgi:hypothetical protein
MTVCCSRGVCCGVLVCGSDALQGNPSVGAACAWRRCCCKQQRPGHGQFFLFLLALQRRRQQAHALHALLALLCSRQPLLRCTGHVGHASVVACTKWVEKHAVLGTHGAYWGKRVVPCAHGIRRCPGGFSMVGRPRFLGWQCSCLLLALQTMPYSCFVVLLVHLHRGEFLMQGVSGPGDACSFVFGCHVWCGVILQLSPCGYAQCDLLAADVQCRLLAAVLRLVLTRA